MSDLGLCSRCAEPAVMVVNGKGACNLHLNSVMAQAFNGVRVIRRRVGL